MKITITVEEPTSDFQDRLLNLLKDYAGQVQVDTTWTRARARQYFLALPARAQRIVKETATRQDGFVPANDLRDSEDSSLRGHAAPLKRILEKGAREGWWPAGMEPPIQAQGPGFGKVVGYLMPEHLQSVFQSAANNTSRDW
ncbi:hypothetical protein ACFVY0_34085 [Streptomyces sp. NPDC058286]|uniref:hypothetical protein n=1 Tax=Streptomyces sp. NPDC058286 TaxID=3346422 RepID=UPI0036ECBBF6